MRPSRLDYTDDNCGIRAALDILGEKWTLLVLREAFYGVRRFDDFRRLVGCARNVLSARLRTLVDEGILVREPYHEPGKRVRHEYRLTDKGRDLFPILVSLLQWGDRHRPHPAGRAVVLTHRDCRAEVGLEICCAGGHRGLSARDVEVRPGEGAVAAA